LAWFSIARIHLYSAAGRLRGRCTSSIASCAPAVASLLAWRNAGVCSQLPSTCPASRPPRAAPTWSMDVSSRTGHVTTAWCMETRSSRYVPKLDRGVSGRVTVVEASARPPRPAAADGGRRSECSTLGATASPRVNRAHDKPGFRHGTRQSSGATRVVSRAVARRPGAGGAMLGEPARRPRKVALWEYRGDTERRARGRGLGRAPLPTGRLLDAAGAAWSRHQSGTCWRGVRPWAPPGSDSV